jgi:hypothetical protein
VGGVLIATLLLAVYAYSTHNQLLLVGLPAFTILVFLLSKARFTYATAIALSTSSLTLPGLPSKVNLYLRWPPCLHGLPDGRRHHHQEDPPPPARKTNGCWPWPC